MLRIIIGAWGILALSQAPVLATCEFHPSAGSWEGSCGKWFDQKPTLMLAPAKSITTGRWRDGVQPEAVWAGEITDSGSANTRIELEIYRGGSGILRTEYGWFAVSSFSAGGPSLRFALDTANEVVPSALDRQIVRRAAAILSSISVWNRADNRVCPMTATTWSIYCAMERATVEVTGGFHHRRPALELVRQIVEARSAGRPYDHRLMDYNNDPSTRLDDVTSLFTEALARMDR